MSVSKAPPKAPDSGWATKAFLDGSLCFSTLGEPISVRASVRKLTAPHLLWCNERWFLQAGVEMARQGVRQEVEAWLLDTYGVVTAETIGGLPGYVADRYGGTLGAVHGGSGRCISTGGFNAKGVGRTSLVPAQMTGGHSNGLLPLDEAIREAINAEIAIAEFPHGAVPIIAIIDPGDGLLADGRRRAIVVRPNFLRPAHLERSIFYGTSGFVGSDQHIDAARVRHIAGMLATQPDSLVSSPAFFSQAFCRLAEQVGAGHALRLWPGRFLTSNVCLDGRIVDLASFRAVPNWRRARGEPDEIFGDELRAMWAAADSLAFYVRKYAAGAPVVDLADLRHRIAETMTLSFHRTIMYGCGLSDRKDQPFTEEFVRLIADYFAAEQRRAVANIADHSYRRQPWLYDALQVSSRTRAPQLETDLARELLRLESQIAGPRPSVQLSRWLRPRPHLYYEIAAPRTDGLVRRLASDPAQARDQVRRHIVATVSRNRRHWRKPEPFLVGGQVTDLVSSALFGLLDDRPYLLLEGLRQGDSVHIFNSILPLAHLEKLGAQVTDDRVTLGLSIEDETGRGGATIAVGAQIITVPPACFIY